MWCGGCRLGADRNPQPAVGEERGRVWCGEVERLGPYPCQALPPSSCSPGSRTAWWATQLVLLGVSQKKKGKEEGKCQAWVQEGRVTVDPRRGGACLCTGDAVPPGEGEGDVCCKRTAKDRAWPPGTQVKSREEKRRHGDTTQLTPHVSRGATACWVNAVRAAIAISRSP